MPSSLESIFPRHDMSLRIIGCGVIRYSVKINVVVSVVQILQLMLTRLPIALYICLEIYAPPHSPTSLNLNPRIKSPVPPIRDSLWIRVPYKPPRRGPQWNRPESYVTPVHFMIGRREQYGKILFTFAMGLLPMTSLLLISQVSKCTATKDHRRTAFLHSTDSTGTTLGAESVRITELF